MRILDYGLVFVVAFSLVFSAAHIISGASPMQQFQNGVNVVGSFVADAAHADENPSEPIDFSKLLRADDRTFEVHAEPWVQTEVLSSSVIRKIGYGKERRINVVRTPGGTYSSDGLISPHIQYAGIEVTETTPRPGAVFWQKGLGWRALPNSGKSFTKTYGRVEGGGRFVTMDGWTCVSGPGYRTCN